MRRIFCFPCNYFTRRSEAIEKSPDETETAPLVPPSKKRLLVLIIETYYQNNAISSRCLQPLQPQQHAKLRTFKMPDSLRGSDEDIYEILKEQFLDSSNILLTKIVKLEAQIALNKYTSLEQQGFFKKQGDFRERKLTDCLVEKLKAYIVDCIPDANFIKCWIQVAYFQSAHRAGPQAVVVSPSDKDTFCANVTTFVESMRKCQCKSLESSGNQFALFEITPHTL